MIYGANSKFHGYYKDGTICNHVICSDAWTYYVCNIDCGELYDLGPAGLYDQCEWDHEELTEVLKGTGVTIIVKEK